MAWELPFLEKAGSFFWPTISRLSDPISLNRTEDTLSHLACGNLFFFDPGKVLALSPRKLGSLFAPLLTVELNYIDPTTTEIEVIDPHLRHSIQQLLQRKKL